MQSCFGALRLKREKHHNKKKEKIMIVCNKCGGTNIFVKAWVDANTNEYDSDIDGTTGWCDECETEIKFKEKILEAVWLRKKLKKEKE